MPHGHSGTPAVDSHGLTSYYEYARGAGAAHACVGSANAVHAALYVAYVLQFCVVSNALYSYSVIHRRMSDILMCTGGTLVVHHSAIGPNHTATTLCKHAGTPVCTPAHTICTCIHTHHHHNSVFSTHTCAHHRSLSVQHRHTHKHVPYRNSGSKDTETPIIAHRVSRVQHTHHTSSPATTLPVMTSKCREPLPLRSTQTLVGIVQKPQSTVVGCRCRSTLFCCCPVRELAYAPNRRASFSGGQCNMCVLYPCLLISNHRGSSPGHDQTFGQETR